MRRDRAHVRAGDETEALRKAAERLEVDPENIELREAREGTYLVIVTRADARLSVRISDDALAATVTELSEPIGDGRPLSEETVREQLQAAGVQVEPDPEALADLLQRAQKGEDVGGIVLATGTPPRDGADGCFESALALDSSVGAEKADGSVDFYERNVAPSVGEGDAIGRITPPEEGTPGRDVRGNVLPAGDGAPAPVRPGANVIVSEDGLELHAEIGGVVVLDGETLSVTQTFQIPGDVDFSTGNVRMEGGSLEVGGTVRSGFTVTCKGDLEVGGAIEEATIEVGGDVSVGGGIVMGEEGRLRAGGDVSARFAENAHIEAGGDVVIDNDVSNCHVVAAGRLVATGGKGRIQGGDIRADGGIRANEVGSSLHVRTVLTVGRRPEGYDDLVARRDELRDKLDRIRRSLGSGDTDEILRRAPEAKRETVSKLQQVRRDIRRRLKEVALELAEHRERLRGSCDAEVRVERTLFPGTTVKIAGATLQVQEPMQGCVLRYDAEPGSVVATPL